MVVAPDDIPATTPVDELMVAVAELLFQVPPDVASVKVVLEPTHMLDEPVIADGIGLTVIVFIAEAAPHAFVMV